MPKKSSRCARSAGSTNRTNSVVLLADGAAGVVQAGNAGCGGHVVLALLATTPIASSWGHMSCCSCCVTVCAGEQARCDAGSRDTIWGRLLGAHTVRVVQAPRVSI